VWTFLQTNALTENAAPGMGEPCAKRRMILLQETGRRPDRQTEDDDAAQLAKGPISGMVPGGGGGGESTTAVVVSGE